ncbi:hypothetical protein ACFQZ2_16920, partial [Streptomonospora algeriensis]
MTESARMRRSPASDGARPPSEESAAPLDGFLAEAVEGFLADFFAERSAAAAADGFDADFDAEALQRLRDFTLAGGKRIRPAFAWWGWRAAG